MTYKFFGLGECDILGEAVVVFTGTRKPQRAFLVKPIDRKWTAWKSGHGFLSAQKIESHEHAKEIASQCKASYYSSDCEFAGLPTN